MGRAREVPPSQLGPLKVVVWETKEDGKWTTHRVIHRNEYYLQQVLEEQIALGHNAKLEEVDRSNQP